MKLFSGNAARARASCRIGRTEGKEEEKVKEEEEVERTGDEQEPHLSISRLVIFPRRDGEQGLLRFFPDRLFTAASSIARK